MNIAMRMNATKTKDKNETFANFAISLYRQSGAVISTVARATTVSRRESKDPAPTPAKRIRTFVRVSPTATL
jgi:hypothetical protein